MADLGDTANGNWITLRATLATAFANNEELIREWMDFKNDYLQGRSPQEAFRLGQYAEVTAAAAGINTPYFVDNKGNVSATTGPKS
jgi:hypothetical protein